MSKFIVDLGDTPSSGQPAHSPLAEYAVVRERGKRRKILKIVAGAVLVLLVAGGIAGYFYWQNLKKTPQYSLALLVDAARRDDQKTIDDVINTNAVVDDFMPQITGKAIELYGRGLPPETISRISLIAQPVMPAIKERARDALPKMIRDKTAKFQNIPFWAMAAGAERYLEIRIEGDIAYVKSKVPDRPLEVVMRRNGEKWQIVGVKDEELATRIAEKVGQSIIALASRNGVNAAGERLGIKNLQDVLNQARDLLEQ
jgi:hypothetical protein